MRALISRIVAQEDLNFLLTNRIPRRLATDFMGWFSKIEQPLVAKASIAVWRLFSDVDLSEAAESRFVSMHACFTRRLRPEARPFDPARHVLASPCDAIIGACGRIEGDTLHQIKGAPYRLSDLLGTGDASPVYEGGTYLTLRLTAGMYHHFHAPHDLTVERITYISGDCWNVNPIALKRVAQLFCKNERAALHCRLSDGTPIILVAVAAVLVASIQLSFLDTRSAIRTGGPRTTKVEIPLSKGAEMGWFEHGSTILMLCPPGYELAQAATPGMRIQVGQALLCEPPKSHASGT